MRLEELVSDWELDEIRDELSSGTAPDIVAFRHGIPIEVMPKSKSRKKLQDHSSYRIWTDAERAFVRDNFPSHGTSSWRGWSFLNRSWPSIEYMAVQLGVTNKQRERPWTDGEVAFVKDNYPNHGKGWGGWKYLKRTWASIRMKASNMGVKRRKRSLNERWRKSNGRIIGYGK